VERAHETLVAVAGCVLGEVGVSVCERPGMSGLQQLEALALHTDRVDPKAAP